MTQKKKPTPATPPPRKLRPPNIPLTEKERYGLRRPLQVNETRDGSTGTTIGEQRYHMPPNPRQHEDWHTAERTYLPYRKWLLSLPGNTVVGYAGSSAHRPYARFLARNLGAESAAVWQDRIIFALPGGRGLSGEHFTPAWVATLVVREGHNVRRQMAYDALRTLDDALEVYEQRLAAEEE